MTAPLAPRRAPLALLAASLLLAPAAALALDPDRALSQYVHDLYDHRAGLPMNSIHAVHPARDGGLWIGTQEGLVRFDGGSFRTFDPRTVPGVTSPWVTALAEDDEGALWIGTYGGGLLVRRDGRLSRHPASDRLPSPVVNFLVRDGGRGLFIGTERGVVWLDPQRGDPVRFGGLPEGRAIAGHRDPDGGLWVGTPRGLYRLSGGVFVEGPADLRGVQVNDLTRARDGALWVSTLERGLVRLEGERTRVFGPAEGLPTADVVSALEDRDGTLWVATMSGLARLRRGTIERWTGNDTLASDPIRALAEDREGNVWVGSESSGLSRFRDGDFVTFGAEEGLAQDNVSSLLQDRHGAIWIGTQAGLSRLAGGRFTTFGRTDGLAHPIVYGMLEDRDGDLWIGTNGGGVGRRRGGAFTWYGRAQGLSDPFVRALLQGRDGRLWAATGTGLHVLRGDRFEVVPARAGSDLAAAHVTALAEDPQGGLYAATEMHGLLRVRGGVLEPAEASPPPGTVLTTLTVEPDGTLWVGTLGDGVWRLRQGRAAHFTTATGLFDDTAFAVVDDRLGHLWISTNRGVYRVSRGELEEVAAGQRRAVTSVAYGVADGIRGRECNGGSQPSAWRASDGRLWFPTIRGVAVVDPARLRPDVPPPPALVEQAVVDGRRVDVGDRLVLPPGTVRLELRYGAIAFTGRERIGFRYRLEGLDADWQEGGADTVAHYTSLPPGDYRFVVETRVGAGPWSAPSRAVAVELRPRLLQSGWFYALVAAALALALGLGDRLRVAGLRRRERELQARVGEAMAQVKVLSGMLPICAWCKKIRDDRGDWQPLEAYLGERSHAEFSHAMCPECYGRSGATAHTPPLPAGAEPG